MEYSVIERGEKINMPLAMDKGVNTEKYKI